MDSCFSTWQKAISSGELNRNFAHGLEREALRITPSGALSSKDHPRALGDKFTHPYITTDYAENQLEFITPVFDSIHEAESHLLDMQAWAQSRIDTELLWPLSMPPDMCDPESEIRIAHYGDSPEGTEKEIYRRGLAERYGKGIQIVSGVHYNFSFTDVFWHMIAPSGLSDQRMRDFKNERYMSLVRNFLRYRFLVVYAFGASPVAPEGYPQLEQIEELCPTSIRMSRYGYSNTCQRKLLVSYDSVEEYVRDMRYALHTSHPEYEKIGTHQGGEQIQLNTNILQLPAEYYSPVRIKPSQKPGEDLLSALEKRGISRLEFRAFDVSPFNPSGVEREQLCFFLVLMLYAFFQESPKLSAQERKTINDLQTKVALCGRKPDFHITWEGESLPIEKVCEKAVPCLLQVAESLDVLHGCSHYQRSVKEFCRSIRERDTVSLRMMQEMQKKNLSHHEYGLLLAQNHANALRGISVSDAVSCALESGASL